MTFDYNPILNQRAPTLVREDIGGERHYIDEQGEKYLSVTAFLNRIPNKALEAWKADAGKFGEDLARASAIKGDRLHQLTEDFLSNKEIELSNDDGSTLFKILRPQLIKNVTKVHGIEVRLFSPSMKLAGTMDLGFDWDHITSVGDIKGSRRIKTETDILGYYLQLQIYLIMCSEILGYRAKQTVILMATEELPEPLIFKSHSTKYLHEVAHLVKKYR